MAEYEVVQGAVIAGLLLAFAGAAHAATLWQSGTYSYDGQGNIRAIGNDIFYYDSLGRLKYGDAGANRKQEYTYDDYGNITSIRTDGGTTQIVAVDPATNQLKATGGNFIGVYDAEGNLTTLNGTDTFMYDRLGSVTRSTVGYMHARYYGSRVGRFLSVDPAMDVAKNMAEPQRWNRYSYVTNNSMKYDDPDGRERRILLLSFHTPSEMRLPLILDATPAHSKGIDSGYSIDARHSLGGKSLLHALNDIDDSGTDIAVINSHGGKPLQTDTGGGADGSRRFSFGAADIAKNVGGRPQAIVLAGCGTMDSAQAVANATGTTVFGIRSRAESYAHQISRAGTVLANVYAATGNADFAMAVANRMLKRHCPSNGGTCSGVPEFQVVQPARQ